MKKTKILTIATFACISFISVIILLLGLTFSGHFVVGANATNVTSRVNITNTEPTIYATYLDDSQSTPGSEIDLSPGTTVTVWCNASVYDADGYDDISTVTAVFYKQSVGPGASDDNNTHYTNSSCTTPCAQISATNASCSCTFDVQFHADNDTWLCNITVTDTQSVSASANTATVTVNPLLALNTPSEIDYGNMSVNQNSSDVEFNITNYGNVAMNISVSGFGHTPSDDLSMNCTLNNISIDLERYSITADTDFDSMTNLTASSAMIGGFTVPQKTLTLPGINATYWKLFIPEGTAGDCNGTVSFEASVA